VKYNVKHDLSTYNESTYVAKVTFGRRELFNTSIVL